MLAIESRNDGDAMMSPADASHPALNKELPEADGDFYLFARTLSEEEDALRLKVRTFMEQDVQPIIAGYWERAVTIPEAPAV